MDRTPEEQAEADRQEQEAAAKREARGDNVEGDDEGGAQGELSAADLAAVAGDDEPKSVPYGRFREVAKERTSEREARIRLEAENEILRKSAAPPAAKAAPDVDVKALRKQRNGALLEGDTDKASELEEQIDAENERRLSAKIRSDTVLEMTQAQQRREFNKVAAQVAQDYPFFGKGEDKNQEAVDELWEWQGYYVNKGFEPAEALEKAVKRVAPAYAPAKPGESDDDLSRRRQALAVSRGADAARRQPPPTTAGKGARASGDSPIKSVETLSDDEFNKLPDAEKRRLRGDSV